MKNLASCFCLLFALGLPLIDFALVVRMVYIASVPGLLSPFVAILVGCVIGIVVCIVFIAGQGSTVVEIVVPSLILLFFLLLAYPAVVKIPATRRANLQKRALKAKQQLTPTSSKHS